MGVVVGAELSFQRRAGILQPLWPWTHPPCAAVSPNLRGTMMLPMGRSRESQSSQKPWSTPSSQGSRLLLSLSGLLRPLPTTPSASPLLPSGSVGHLSAALSSSPRAGPCLSLSRPFPAPGRSTWPLPRPIVSGPRAIRLSWGKQGSPPPPFPHSGLDSKSLTQPLTK